jgi:hypothetical protein
VPDRTLKFLLNHENLLISTHAAVGEWCAIPKGEVRVSISEEWKQAILKAEGHEFWIGEILKGDKALAFDWVIRRIQGGSSLVHFFVVNELKAAISVLDSNQRLAVLHHINIEGYSTSVLISELGKEDLQVYAAILKEPRFSKYHLASLGGHPTELWTEKVIRAISAGYSPDQIANSTLHYDNSWSGDESAMWQRWIDDFNSFRTHPDPGVCSVAELGITKALQRQALAAEEEHREAVYGI